MRRWRHSAKGKGKGLPQPISLGEERLALQMRCDGLPLPEREFRFGAYLAGGPGKGLRERLSHVGLKDWRFDFAWPGQLLAVEVEGGTRAGGRHNRHAGFSEDCTKYNAAQVHGWRVLRFTTEQVNSGQALATIKQAMGVDSGS